MADEIRNDELLQAIADMRETYKKTHESGSDDHTAINEANTKVINLTLHSNFLVPAVISKNTQLVQDKDNHLKFEDKPQARFMLVKHSQNGTFLPVFTDSEEFEKVPHDAEFQLVNMKFSDVATLTEQTPTINGFVINPMTTNLVRTVTLGDATHLSPVLDLSALDGPFVLPASNFTLGAAEGAKVHVDIGARVVTSKKPIIAWTTPPADVSFVWADGIEDRGSLVVREDGLYAVYLGLIISIH